MKIRKFRLIEAGVDIGGFDVEGVDEGLPDEWQRLIDAADTETTFTFEKDGQIYLGVSIMEVFE